MKHPTFGKMTPMRKSWRATARDFAQKHPMGLMRLGQGAAGLAGVAAGHDLSRDQESGDGPGLRQVLSPVS